MGQSVNQNVLIEYIEVLRRRRWSVIIPAVVISALTVPIVLRLPVTYKATTLIAVEAQKIPEALVRTTVTTPIEDRLQAISQQILSRTRLERVVEKYGLSRGAQKSSVLGSDTSNQDRSDVSSKLRMLDSVELLKHNIQIQVPQGRNSGSSGTISISYNGDNPQTVMDVTNELASLFIEENLKVREAQAEGTTEFLEHELQRLKVQLEAREEQLRSFKQRFMGELPSQLETNLRTLDRLQMERQVLQESLKTAEDRYADLSRQLGGEAAAPTGGVYSPSELTRHLQTLRSKLATLRAEYHDEYPDVILLQKEIGRVEAQLAAQQDLEMPPDVPRVQGNSPAAAQMAEQQRQVKAIKQRQQANTDQIRDYEKRVENTPSREQQLAMIMRDYENVQRSYQSMLDKRQEAKISESLEQRQKGELFRILDPAILPQRPYKPNRQLLILLGICGGLAAGLGLAFVREQLDPSIQSEEDLVAATTGVPLLAVVPFITESGKPPARRRPPPVAKAGPSR